MKISFCTTCKGRLEHLKETLPQNLSDNPNTDDVQVEFVVVNYGDEDGMHEWMMTDPQMRAEIESGRIKYYVSEQPVFRMAHSKNLSHRLATGDVVCNVDADNFTGPNFAKGLALHFQDNMDSVLSPSYRVSRFYEASERGFLGRVALSRINFNRLGGYDESFVGWGGEDTDFTRRAKLAGLHHMRFENPTFLRVIGHSHEMRAQYMFDNDGDNQAELKKILQLKESAMATQFFTAGVARVKTLTRPIVANLGRNFGVADVVHHDVTEDREISMKPKNLISQTIAKTYAGVVNVVVGRTRPNTILLKGQDDGPS